jgi:hypothetical protein
MCIAHIQFRPSPRKGHAAIEVETSAAVTDRKEKPSIPCLALIRQFGIGYAQIATKKAAQIQLLMGYTCAAWVISIAAQDLHTGFLTNVPI